MVDSEPSALAIPSIVLTSAPSASAFARLAEGQERLIEVLSKQEETGLDAESRMRLRSIDVQMLRILEEISAGRQESMGELRADIAQLTKAIRLMGRRSSDGL